MGRSLEDIIAAMPPERREAVAARTRELIAEVEGLRALRRIAGKAQGEIARKLRIKQPSVSRIERQTDMYLSTLKSYVEAMGGTLDLVVKLPGHADLRIENLGESLDTPPAPSRRRAAPKRLDTTPAESAPAPERDVA